MEKEKGSRGNEVEEEEENAGGCEKTKNKKEKTSKIPIVKAGKPAEKIREQTAILSPFTKRTYKLDHQFLKKKNKKKIT